KQPENFKALYTPELADQVWVKPYRGGKWGAPVAVTGPRESIARCAVAAEGNGTVWVAYSALRGGRHGIFARPLRPGKDPGGEGKLGAELEIVPGGRGQEINPVACTDQQGDVHLLYQTWPTVIRPANPGLRFNLRKVVIRDGKPQAPGAQFSADGNV